MSANSYTNSGFFGAFNRIRLQRGLFFGIIILTALIAFELFNYSTTEYALEDLLGNLSFLGISWATILAIAFCGIDFAGIARLHTPQSGSGQVSETWYLFGAWLLAATMNAMLTWWGVSLAIVNHSTLGNAVVERETLLRVVPIFVAILVWLIRVLIIGTYSQAGNRLLTQREYRAGSVNRGYFNNQNAQPTGARTLGAPSNNNAVNAPSFRSVQRPPAQNYENNYNRQDPVYTPVHSASPARSASPSQPGTSAPQPNPYSTNPGMKRRN